MIQIKNLSKAYGELTALSDVSFNMDKGEIIGLLGVNGAGKSTLMKILCGVLVPDSGEVFFDEKPFDENKSEIKKRIGYLSEDNPLYDDMYVREYLEYTAGIYHVDKKRIPFLIEQTGLQREYKKKIRELSKGNRQRTGIAQVLINDPEFLILDEATSGLDPNQRESLMNLLKRLSDFQTILFSSHILQEVKGISSRVILLDQGEIKADKQIGEIGSIENLFHTLTNENNS
ncbi:MAG: ABC transporter ATP-binding protein [Prevotella sp.]|nr:ABC transporter ATP-binding protein [Prevotella sp.]